MRHDDDEFEFWKSATEKLVSICGLDLLESGDIQKIREKLKKEGQEDLEPLLSNQRVFDSLRMTALTL